MPPGPRRTPARMLWLMARRVALAGSFALVAALSLAACESDAPPTSAPATPTVTGLSDLATDNLPVTRGEFCDEIPSDAVEAALDAPATDSRGYANGDRTRLTPRIKDVAHEFGCSWTAADGTVARAWVFAPPVTRGQARALRASAAEQKGCSPVPGAPAFGSPSTAVQCAETMTFHGLFGDAWLSCSLDSTDLERVGRWCASVVQTAG